MSLTITPPIVLHSHYDVCVCGEGGGLNQWVSVNSFFWELTEKISKYKRQDISLMDFCPFCGLIDSINCSCLSEFFDEMLYASECAPCLLYFFNFSGQNEICTRLSHY